MNGTTPESEDPARQLIDAAVEDISQTNRRRAEVDAIVRTPARQRAALGALMVALPVLGILFVTNIQGRSLTALLRSAPPPAVARQRADEAVRFVASEIESFRKDFSELPSSLAEVGTPPDGEWSYTRTSGNDYQITLRIHGQVVTFDSHQPLPK